MNIQKSIRQTRKRSLRFALALLIAVTALGFASAVPAQADEGELSFEQQVAAVNKYAKSWHKAWDKPYSDHCWKHDKKYKDSIRCLTGKKYQDFEAVNLTGPHYDIETGRAQPGPALRDIRITTPSLFKKSEVLVQSEYNLDKDGDGTNERLVLVSATYVLDAGETIALRVPIAPNDPRCGGHDITVRMTDKASGRVVGESFRGLNSPEGVDLDNPPPIERIG